ncbi:MAG: hypothetical protein ACE5FO_07925 [Parvularculaceae bacterium]
MLFLAVIKRFLTVAAAAVFVATPTLACCQESALHFGAHAAHIDKMPADAAAIAPRHDCADAPRQPAPSDRDGCADCAPGVFAEAITPTKAAQNVAGPMLAAIIPTRAPIARGINAPAVRFAPPAAAPPPKTPIGAKDKLLN